jgi:nucleotidyltransferase/DNA polymerase involved in DNA repair
MIACLAIPAFPLRAAVCTRPDLALQPVALAPAPGQRDLIGSCNAKAERAGIRPRMPLGEALSTCPSLVLVEQDPAAVEEEWERMLRRLEDAGLAVEPVEPGCAYFDTTGVERLAGGLRAVLRRALDAAGPDWHPRIGAARRRFTALAAASIAPPCRAIVVDDGEEALFLEPLPLDLLPLAPERRRELSELGVRRLGELARLPRPSVADRLGGEGDAAWALAAGKDRSTVTPREPSADIVEALAFPEAVANSVTLVHALVTLLDRLLARPERAGREPRQLTVSALLGGGSWRRTLTMREPTAERDRLRAVLAPTLSDLPGPVLELRLELGALTDCAGRQEELVQPRGARLRERLREGLRQVRAGAGIDAVCAVVEVAPWSRVPETRALLVPRDD